MNTVTIDFDNIKERQDELKDCLYSFLPCKIRISGGKNGVHLKKYCTDEEYKTALQVREKYDDPKRLLVDRINGKVGLTTNILLSRYYKRGKLKIAGEWIIVRNRNEAEITLKKLLEVIQNDN